MVRAEDELSCPIMGQNERRSPIMNPVLLLRALTAGLVAARC